MALSHSGQLARFGMTLEAAHAIRDKALAAGIDCNAARFPYGRHIESDGRAYVWTYALDPRHMPSARAMAASLPRPRAPVPSAASAILERLQLKRN